MVSIYFLVGNLLCTLIVAVILAICLAEGIRDGFRRYVYMMVEVLCVFSIVAVESHAVYQTGSAAAAAILVIMLLMGMKRSERYRYGIPVILIIILAETAELMLSCVVLLPFASTFAVVSEFMILQQGLILVDGLTGLNNRKELERYLAGKLSAMTEEDVMHAAMIDIDGFKTINDTYGHMTGDRCIIRFSEALKRVCAEAPGRVFLARYGGDEFVMAGVNGKTEEYEKVGKALENILDGDTDEIPIHFSIGWTYGSRGEYESAADIVEKADRAMYMDKKRKGEKKEDLLLS